MGRLTFGFFVCCLSIITDHVYHQYTISEFPYDRIIIDSLCHQGIACLSTLTYFSIFYNTLLSSTSASNNSNSATFSHVSNNNIATTNTKAHFQQQQQHVSKRYLFLSLIFGALVDLDHILSSQSWTIQGALHLPYRPIGHSIAFIFLITTLLRIISSCDTNVPIVYSLASLSHLIRDSSRRGLWFFLSVKTGPVSYLLHLVLLCLLPYVVLYSSYILERVFKTFSGAFAYCVNTLCCQSSNKYKSSSRNYYQYYRQIAQSRPPSLTTSSSKGDEDALLSEVSQA